MTTYGHTVLLVIPLEGGGQEQWQIFARKAFRPAEPVRQ